MRARSQKAASKVRKFLLREQRDEAVTRAKAAIEQARLQKARYQALRAGVLFLLNPLERQERLTVAELKAWKGLL